MADQIPEEDPGIQYFSTGITFDNRDDIEYFMVQKSLRAQEKEAALEEEIIEQEEKDKKKLLDKNDKISVKIKPKCCIVQETDKPLKF